MELPRSLENAIREIGKLPGIGQKTAFRLALHILKLPTENAHRLSTTIAQLKEDIVACKRCFNLSERDICTLCLNAQRDTTQLCIVEDIRDLLAIEDTSEYNGLYHVLGGKISPMDGVGIDDLNIMPLLDRVKKEEKIEEIIFAMSATLEADTTTLYLYKKLHIATSKLSFSSLARGVSIGESPEYVDPQTLGRSITERTTYST